uniref:Putative transposase n=1 Tax=Streptoalloteichus tenebrarius (strain ATCC 17920 / DSM 40477 / JCM 4838 / CBS 697.72 / NBRC 16177 / NCIMB 11028 / NRRL B-12390 / A12253. 1 / ISP 5477) TaxID=1933 RepID=Q2MFK7_STRSD
MSRPSSANAGFGGPADCVAAGQATSRPGRRSSPGVRPRRLPASRIVVERRVDRLQRFRVIATRGDKTVISYREMADLATLLIRLRGQAPGRRR